MGIQKTGGKFVLYYLLTFLCKIETCKACSLRILKKFKPDIVIGTGGFASGPILKVAQLLGLPTLIQEQNSYPGVTNRILSKNANRICVAYQGLERYLPKKKIIITGNPIRENLTKIKIGSKAKLLFGLNPKMKTLVIIGGSLGSKRINQLIEKQKEFILKSGIQILWQCGSLYYSEYKNLESKEIVIRPYFDKMENVYAAADFIISRVYFNLRFGLLDSLIHTLLPLFKSPYIEPVLGQCAVTIFLLISISTKNLL